MWIKICGLTSPDAVAAALDAGADAVGFVFAKSVRQVTPREALDLAKPARGRVRCVWRFLPALRVRYHGFRRVLRP